MKRATVPAPSPRYAKFAKLLREEGLEVQDDDFELIDLVVKESATGGWICGAF
jgi:hypothetical protein